MNMKALFALLTAILLLPVLCAAQAKKMPAFRFVNTDNEAVTNKDIPKGQPLLLVYFRSDCDHCIHTAQALKTTAAQYPAAIWMVSGEEMPEIRTYEEMNGLLEQDNVSVMQDDSHKMHIWFTFTQLPFIVLFNKNGKQLKVYKELPSAAEIKKALAGK